MKYRIVKSNCGNYSVQKKGWLLWWDCSFWIDPRTNTESDMCIAFKTIEEAERRVELLMSNGNIVKEYN